MVEKNSNFRVNFIRSSDMRKLKRKINLFFRKHYKIYTLLVLALGIFLGLLYEGKGDLGEYIFSLNDYVIYIGGFEKVSQ